MDLPLLRNAQNLKGKRVLLRLGLNVPIQDKKILDDFRIKKILPTLSFLLKKKARVIILSHHSDVRQSLRPVAEYLNAYFISDILNASGFQKIESEGKSSIVLCENLRLWGGETQNDLEFAKRLASLGDIYVNDAFSASHRKHASIVLLPKLLSSYVGLLFEKEIRNLSVALNPPKQFLFILGGAKARTKLPLVEKFLANADTIFIGGALANNFFKEQGYEIGQSSFEEANCDVSKLIESGKICLPVDVVVGNENGAFRKLPNELSSGDNILDAGPRTVSLLRDLVKKAHFILWNGPLGDYLIPSFEKATEELIKILAASDAQMIVGGGDTVAMISQMDIEDKFAFLSTGGGAMLEFIAKGTLPGIEALKISE